MKKEVLAPINVKQQDDALNFGQRAQDVFVLVIIRIRRIKKGGNDGGDGEIKNILSGLVSKSSPGVTVTDHTNL